MNKSFVSLRANTLDGEVKLVPSGSDEHKMVRDHIAACGVTRFETYSLL